MCDALVISGSYLIGCVSSGYILVRWRTGQDIRFLGSGSTGARNVARIVGCRWGVVVLLLDVSRGALAVFLARWWGAEHLCLPLLAVVAGHIWPAPLRFRGGKGIALSLGGLLALTPALAFIILAIFLLSLVITRRYILSGTVAVGLAPIAGSVSGSAHPLCLATLAGMVIFAHRANLRPMYSPEDSRDG